MTESDQTAPAGVTATNNEGLQQAIPPQSVSFVLWIVVFVHQAALAAACQLRDHGDYPFWILAVAVVITSLIPLVLLPRLRDEIPTGLLSLSCLLIGMFCGVPAELAMEAVGGPELAAGAFILVTSVVGTLFWRYSIVPAQLRAATAKANPGGQTPQASEQ